MKSGYRPPGEPSSGILKIVLMALFGGFLVQVFFEVGLNQNAFLGTRGPDVLGKQSIIADYGALSLENLGSYRVWTLFTYGLLHGGPIHLFFNGLATFFLWRGLRDSIPEKAILQLYIVGVVFGGLVWSAVRLSIGDGVLVGASGGVVALLAALCLSRWNDFAFLLFPPIPVRLKWLYYGVLFFDGFGFLLYEIGKAHPFEGVAHSAHLGGFALGTLFYRTYLATGRFRSGELWIPRKLPGFSMRKRSSIPRKSAARPKTTYRVNLSEPRTGSADLKAEVDRILDKINEKGFGSLNDEERKVLERAGELLNR